MKLKYSNYISLFNDCENDHLLLEIISIKTRTKPLMSLLLQFDNDSSKSNWIEDLKNVMLAYHKDSQFSRQLGWYHDIILGNIHSAAYNGDATLLRKHLRYIESNNIPIDLQDKAGMTPLHWAVLNGHHICVQILLDHGADPELKQKGSNTSLLLAASRGHDTITRLLLDHGANIKERNIQDKNILYMAVVFGSSSKGLPYLLQIINNRGIDLNQFDRDGYSALHICAEMNISRPIRILVDAGSNVNSKHKKSGLTPLLIACSNSSPDIETIRSLLDKGAYCNLKDSLGRTALALLLQNQPMGSLTPTNSIKKASISQHVDKITREDQESSDRQSTVLDEGSKWRNMELTLELVGIWTVKILPSILEIVRKGGRFELKDIETLRPSFRVAMIEARVLWDDKTVPSNFNEFINQRIQSGEEFRIPRSDWTKDKSTSNCELCACLFTIKSRRHHCRACGALICDNCSNKRLPLNGIISKTLIKTPTKSKSSSFSSNKSFSNDDKLDRVCDSCFNCFCFEASQPSPENYRIRNLKQCAIDLIDSIGVFIDSLDDNEDSDNRETLTWKDKSPTNVTWSTYNDSPSSSGRESMASTYQNFTRATNERLSIRKPISTNNNSIDTAEMFINKLKSREDKLSRCEDIIYKFLEASEGYHKSAKLIIEKKTTMIEE